MLRDVRLSRMPTLRGDGDDDNTNCGLSFFSTFQSKGSVNSRNQALAMSKISSPNENGASFSSQTVLPSLRPREFTRTSLSYISSSSYQFNVSDVLMGRGGKNNQYIGNEKLRLLARQRCREYQEATKKGKSSISRELVDTIRKMTPPGR